MSTLDNRVTPNRREFTDEARITRLVARGARLRANVAGAVLSGSLDLSTDEATQLTLTLSDPDDELLGSGLFVPGDERKAGSRLDFDDLALEVSAVEVTADAGGTLTVTARSHGVQQLRRAKGHMVRKGLSPTRFAELLAKDAGLKFVGEPSHPRHVIQRQGGEQAETSWDTLQRLASELGFDCFEATGVLYFGKPTWIIGRDAARVFRLSWDGRHTDKRVLGKPTCRRTSDDEKKLATVEAHVTGTLGDDVRPGHRFVLDGIPHFAGRYIVDRVTIPLLDAEPVVVSGATPINPTPEPPPKPAKASSGPAGASSGPSGGKTGVATGSNFAAIALAQAGDSYIYGAEAAGSNPNPSAFDCSELVQWAAARCGVSFVDGSSAQIAAARSISVAQAIKTRGAILWHPGHIAISLGNGMTIEAANSRVGVVSYSASGRFQRGGLIPGLAY